MSQGVDVDQTWKDVRYALAQAEPKIDCPSSFAYQQIQSTLAQAQATLILINAVHGLEDRLSEIEASIRLQVS
jgi:hypothetical protein